MKFKDFNLVLNKNESLDHIKLNFVWPVVFKPEDIDDLMTIALEGGINYWCSSATIGEPNYFGTYASDQISRGGSLILVDAEGEKEYTLNLENLISGISKAIEMEYIEPTITDNARIDMTTLDSQDADCIIQCAIFGEVIYG